MRLQLGDLIELVDSCDATPQGNYGRVIDVCPDTGDLLVTRFVSVPAETRLRLVLRASMLTRRAMQAKAFYLRVRDCGWRYAFG
jgi:hypothetical protein